MNSVLKRNGAIGLLLFLFTLTTHAQLKKLVFSPHWHANAQFSGYIAAQKLGYYKDEGLDVEIKYPGDIMSSFELLRDGKADLITGMLTSAIVAKANACVDVVNVLQTSQHSALCLALKSPVDRMDIGTLHGMRVGLWYKRMSIAAEAMNILQHMDWKIIHFRTGYKLMKYDVVDALSVMEYNELLHLKYNGYDVSDRCILRFSEHGYDIPEDGVYCLCGYYKEHPNEVKAFVRATKKGWEWCRKNPRQAVEMVVKEMAAHHVQHSTVIESAGLKVILQKQEATPGKVTYTLQPEQFEKAVATLNSAGLIQSYPEFKSFIAR